MNASLIHEATTLGTAIGIGAEIVCLLIGLILCARRTNGRGLMQGLVTSDLACSQASLEG